MKVCQTPPDPVSVRVILLCKPVVTARIMLENEALEPFCPRIWVLVPFGNEKMILYCAFCMFVLSLSY